jgi:hypothetical protein
MKAVVACPILLAVTLGACGSTPSSITAPTSTTAPSGPGTTSGLPPDKVAQMNLQVALAAAKSAYKETSNFSLSAPPELRQLAPALTLVAPEFNVSAGTNQVGVSNGGDNANQTVTLAALSSTGTCWYLVDVASSDSETVTSGDGINAAGLWYGHLDDATSCTAPDNGPPAGSNLSAGWSRSGF